MLKTMSNGLLGQMVFAKNFSLSFWDILKDDFFEMANYWLIMLLFFVTFVTTWQFIQALLAHLFMNLRIHACSHAGNRTRAMAVRAPHPNH